jgi:tetratricopeptide (TPR) repeat protein
MVTSLAWYWDTKNTVGEGYGWGERVLAIGNDVAPAIRAKALQKVGGRLAVLYGNHQRAEEMLEESVAILRDSGDQRGLAWTLNHMSNVSKVEAHGQAALDLFEELGEKPGYAWTLNTLGEVARANENYEQAKIYYEDCLALAEELNNSKLKATVLHNMAQAVFCLNDYEKAQHLFSEALRVAVELDGVILCVISVAGLASVAALTGEFEMAATLYGYVEAAQAKVSFEIEPVDRYNLGRGLETLKEMMDGDDYRVAYNRGRLMTMEEAIEFGLDGVGVKV